MWKEAIRAVKLSDVSWIKEYRSSFNIFFNEANLKPAGQLDEPALEYHYREKLFKMFLGSRYNGLSCGMETGCRWIENAAVLNSGWGWLLAIGAGGGYFADYLAPGLAEKLFSPEDALVAGSGKPDGKAVKSGRSRWQVNGSWKYCSGSEQASFFTAVTLRDGKISAFVLPVDQAKIIRDWNAVGLEKTCSHTVAAVNAVIAEDHFFDLSQKPRSSEYPLSSYKFLLFARICFVPVVVGIARSFLMEMENYLEDKKPVWEEFQPDRLTAVKDTVVKHNSHILEERNRFYLLVKESWENHCAGKDIKEEEVTQTGLQLAAYCYREIALLIPHLGMAVLEKDHPLQLLWQDLQTAYQHMAFR